PADCSRALCEVSLGLRDRRIHPRLRDREPRRHLDAEGLYEQGHLAGAPLRRRARARVAVALVTERGRPRHPRGPWRGFRVARARASTAPVRSERAEAVASVATPRSPP